MSEKTKALVVGSGGREDALVKLFSESPLISEIICASGNVGIGWRPKTTCVNVVSHEIDRLLALASEKRVGLTVVGPEVPLAGGIVDKFRANNLPIFGPNQAAARIESSKVWAKELMKKCGIPTAAFQKFDDPESARNFARKNLPCVIKADGLASGKGVDVCWTAKEVDRAISRIMLSGELGNAGRQVVIEELLTGRELSFMVLTDGFNVVPLLPARDHKPVWDGDKGPNTGGMGAIACSALTTEALDKVILEKIIFPVLGALRREGVIFRGCLYAGLMLTADGPKVLEFNCRFGDPELQPLAMLIESDIVPVFQAIARGNLRGEILEMSKNAAAVCVVMTSGGYPGKYQKKKVIIGLEDALGVLDSDIFFAGVGLEDGKPVTDSGRVLGPTARAENIPLAAERAYQLVSRIRWEGEHHRQDIG